VSEGKDIFELPHLKIEPMVPAMLDKSRFNRRLHQLSDMLFMMFYQIAQCLKTAAGASEYVIDSFPVAVCDNIRISGVKY